MEGEMTNSNSEHIALFIAHVHTKKTMNNCWTLITFCRIPFAMIWTSNSRTTFSDYRIKQVSIHTIGDKSQYWTYAANMEGTRIRLWCWKKSWMLMRTYGHTNTNIYINGGRHTYSYFLLRSFCREILVCKHYSQPKQMRASFRNDLIPRLG